MFKFSKDWILIHWRHVQTTWLVARKWSRCHWNKSVWLVKVFKLCEVNVSWHSILNCIVHEGSCWPRKCNRLSNRFLLPVILNSLIIQTGSSFMTRGNWRKEIFRMLKRRILDDLLLLVSWNSIVALSVRFDLSYSLKLLGLVDSILKLMSGIILVSDTLFPTFVVH